MAPYVDPDLLHPAPPKPIERDEDGIHRSSGRSGSFERISPFYQVSGISPRGQNSEGFGSSQAQPHGGTSSRSVHWSEDLLSRRLHPPQDLINIDDGSFCDLSDTSSQKGWPRRHRAGVRANGDIPRSKDSSFLRNGPPRYLMAKEVEESTENPQIRRVDGFCYAGDAKDLTVQLSLELRDDLTDEIEQLRLLIQLGRFEAAKKHFKKHLESHAHHPYVRVEYADMLLRQGDYNSLAQLVAQSWGGGGIPQDFNGKSNFRGGIPGNARFNFTSDSPGRIGSSGPGGGSNFSNPDTIFAEFMRNAGGGGLDEDDIADIFGASGGGPGGPRNSGGTGCSQRMRTSFDNGNGNFSRHGDDSLHSQNDIHLGDGRHPDEHTYTEKCQALHQYWSVLRLYTLAVHDIAQLTESDRKDLHASIRSLQKALWHPDKLIGLHEIRILDLLIQLHECFPSTFAKGDLTLCPFLHGLERYEGWGAFYESLLTQGRIWDFRHLFCGLALTAGYEKALSSFLSMPTSSSTEIRLATKRLIADWTGALPEDHLSTNLALLSVYKYAPSMTIPPRVDTVRPDADYLDEFTPLAHSVLSHYPEALRSRPYLDWILCRVYTTNTQGKRDQTEFAALLSMSPGVFMGGELLPMYIPRGNENPGWKMPNAKPEFRNALRMALRIAREIGDCVIQAAALTGLIWTSNDPVGVFEELGTLLKVLSDNNGYAHLLISKYLVSTTPELRNKLKQEVAALLSEPGPFRTMNPDTVWMIKMLYVRLEGSESILSRGPLDEACSLQAEGRLSKELQLQIATRSPFTKDGIQRDPVYAGAHEPERQPFRSLGHQASQRQSSNRQSTTIDTKNFPKPHRLPFHKGLEAFPDNSTNPSESLQPRDRLRQRRAWNILPSPAYGGSNEPCKSKMLEGGGQNPSHYRGDKRDREAPASSHISNNRPQEPSPAEHPLISRANSSYEKVLSQALSMLREKQRIAVDEGDEDRSKALADCSIGIDRELSVAQGYGTGKHPANTPFDKKESERTGSIPTDARSGPSAGGAPGWSELSSPMSPPRLPLQRYGSPLFPPRRQPSPATPPSEYYPLKIKYWAGPVQTEAQERRGNEKIMPAATRTDGPQPARDTPENDDEERATSSTSDSPSRASSDESRHHF